MVECCQCFSSLAQKGFWACLRNLSPGKPRRPDTLFFLQTTAQLSSGRIVPEVTIAKGNSFHPM